MAMGNRHEGYVIRPTEALRHRAPDAAECFRRKGQPLSEYRYRSPDDARAALIACGLPSTLHLHPPHQARPGVAAGLDVGTTDLVYADSFAPGVRFPDGSVLDEPHLAEIIFRVAE